jgi:hypothetical protein
MQLERETANHARSHSIQGPRDHQRAYLAAGQGLPLTPYEQTSRPAGADRTGRSLILSLIHPHAPASIDVHRVPLSRQGDLCGQSCMMILNPENRTFLGRGCRCLRGTRRAAYSPTRRERTGTVHTPWQPPTRLAGYSRLIRQGRPATGDPGLHVGARPRVPGGNCRAVCPLRFAPIRSPVSGCRAVNVQLN